MNKNKNIFVLLVVFFASFIPGVGTISHYNINWDEPVHFARGQAYLHFFLTGKKNYQDLPRHDEFWTKVGNREEYDNLPRYSIYQNTRDMEHFLEKDSGHPPLNGIMAAFFNYIFYQKLGVVSDIESYHLFIIFVSSLLVAVIFQFVRNIYGNFAAMISFLAISTYPSFIAESHNNIKDLPEAAFFTFTLFSFYKTIETRQWRWAILGSIFAGLALGTKFNILFAPIVIVIWLAIRYWGEIKHNFKFLPKLRLKSLFLIFLCLSFPPFIFFATWPYLWQDPIGNTLKIFEYYKKIGTGSTNQPDFLIAGFNIYPTLSILYTTPLITLFLFAVSVLFLFLHFKEEKSKLSLLAFVWFCTTLLRVTIPGSSIYGGTRQIMEYIPAMAILAGIGAVHIITFLTQSNGVMKQLNNRAKLILKLLIVAGFIPITLKIMSIHPNEVVYFNPLIGGFKGAYERDFPSWGSSFGNGYRQAVNWVNSNAEEKARVALVTSTGPNVPFILFREDILYGNGFWSGNEQNGEYLIEEVFDGWKRVYAYPVEYVEKILDPVHEVKVDGVPITKVWKNDIEHTKPEFRNVVDIDEDKIHWEKEEDSILISLTDKIEIININVFYKSNGCMLVSGGLVRLSVDGISWKSLKQQISENYISEDNFYYPVAAYSAKFIELNIASKDRCSYSVSKILLKGIK